MNFLALPVALLLTQDLPAGHPGINPVALDASGVLWVLEFPEALERARQADRLLFIVTDNFQPTADGTFGVEYLRVASLCDPRLSRLINARFIPHYINVSGDTAASSAEGLEFVAAVKSQLGKENQTWFGGMPVLFMTPRGKLVGEVTGGLSTDEIIARAQKVLSKNRSFNGLSEAEQAEKDPLRRAEMSLAVLDYKKARSHAKKDKTAGGRLLEARMAREERDWRSMEKALKKVDDEGLALEVGMERAWHAWFEGEFEEVLALVDPVPDDSARYTEARYLTGLCQHQLSQDEEALETFKVLVESAPQGPFVYRADWSWCNLTQGDPKQWKASSPPPCTSPLGRKFWGSRNPDVDRTGGSY